MTSTHEIPLFWANTIDEALRRDDEIPLYGNAPRFDISLASSILASQLDAPSLSLEIGDCLWREPEQVKKGLGRNVLPLGITLSPLSGEASWWMDRADIAKLAAWFLCGKTRTSRISSEVLQEGFYRYLVLEALDALQQVEPLNHFTLKLDEESEPDTKTLYCIDVKISYDKKSCWGRLALSGHLLTSWRRFFSSLHGVFSLSPFARGLSVPLSVCVGSFNLTMQQWKSLQPGDFVPLAQSGYDARHEEGLATLELSNTPLFYLNVKPNKLKLLDYALFYEESMKKSDVTLEKSETGDLLPTEETRLEAIGELPLRVVVELAQLRMTVDQLVKLVPGNFLELPMHPDREVSLTVDGKKIGRAELVQLGKTLGVRILSIG